MLLLVALVVPLLGSLALFAWRGWSERAARVFAGLVAAAPLLPLAITWSRFDPAGPLFQQVLDVPWIPTIGAGFRLGVDGIALVVAVTSALLFTAAAVYPVDFRGRHRSYLGTVLFLEAASLGVFLALDLLVFYVFFDLSLVGMYFLVVIWGHEERERAALQFLIYTIAGSLVMLLGILSLALAADPITFDMRRLVAEQPLAGEGLRASLTFLAVLFGLAVKTPLVPVHTWLPKAHVEAPSPGSTILAGVLLKMGVYGLIRVGLGMQREAFAAHAQWLAALAVVSVVYGAFVAFAQGHIKRRIAYTSVTHMGYSVLGVSLAASIAAGVGEGAQSEARVMALTGASVEMVAHGLITGALFLIVGSLWRRTRRFAMDQHGGVASWAPRLTGFAIVGCLASLGLPGLAGFVAELQVFAGAIALRPWLAGVALLGLLITAALYLQLLQKVFFGTPSAASRGGDDLGPVETAVLAVLLGATLYVGLAPALVVDLVAASSRTLLSGGG